MVEEIEENWDDYEGETAKDKVMDYLKGRTSWDYTDVKYDKVYDEILSMYDSTEEFAKDVAKCIDEPKKIYESRRINKRGLH